MKRAAALGFAALLACSAGAQELTFRKNAGDFWVYLAVMPSEMISGPPPSAEQLAANPFAPPRELHHVMVSLFDYRSGRRITDAEVQARVAGLGFSGVKKPLERATVAGATLFAGFFPMQGRGPFRVDVEFRAAGARKTDHATFYFSHARFDAPKPEWREEQRK